MDNNKPQQDSLKQKAIAGTIWSAIQKFGISAITFLSNIVLARLLTPDDYGCIGMLAIFLVISNSLILGGFISALIQKKDADDDDFSTVFYWNLVVSIILYLCLFIAAPYIANYYHIDKLCVILRIQGIVLILNGLGAIQTTLLRKFLSFNKLAKINIISSLIAVFIAIYMAFKGYGVWALVAQQIAFSLFNALILWATTTWRPKLRFSTDSFKSLFSYGAFLLFAEIINSICDNIQGLIIGRKFCSATMGFYSQAKKLEEVPTTSISQVVNQVTFPIYTSLQDDKERLKNTVRKTLGLMNYINFPLMLILIVVAKPLFIIIFSDKWLGSVFYFQILCLAGLANCLQSVNYQVVSAVGRSKELFYWNFVKRGIGLLLMLIGLAWGVEGLLLGMVLSTYFTYIVNAKLAETSTGYSLFQQIKDFFPSLCIGLIASVIAYSVVLTIDNNLLLLITQVLVFMVTYLILSYVIKSENFFELISIANKYINKEKK